MSGPTNIPAFPRPAGDFNGTRHGNGAQSGMSLRDYFAAKAMHASMTADPENEADAESHARWAYEMADAMLKARES